MQNILQSVTYPICISCKTELIDTCIKIWVSVFKTISCKKHTNSEVKKHSLKFFSIRSEPRNILKIFLDFTDFEPHYSYKIYSYKKKSVLLKKKIEQKNLLFFSPNFTIEFLIK